MSRRNALIVILLLVASVFTQVHYATAKEEKPVLTIKDYNNMPLVSNDGFEFRMKFDVDKKGNVLTDKDFSCYISNYTKNLPSFRYDKVVSNDLSATMTFEYIIYTDFFIGSIDIVPVVKGYEYKEFAWFNSSWSYKVSIAIDHNQVYDAMTEYPAILDFYSAHLGSYAQEDGDDILFTNDDENDKLYHEIEEYEEGFLTVHVGCNLSSSVDTVIYMYYGNSVCGNQENAVKLWEDYWAVYHGRTLADSTGNGFTLSNHGNNVLLDDADGAFSGGFDFGSADDRYMNQSTLLDDGGDYTISGFVKPTYLGADDPADDYIWYRNDDGTRDRLYVFWNTDQSNVRFYFMNDNEDDILNGYATSYTAGYWHYISAVSKGGVSVEGGVDCDRDALALGATFQADVVGSFYIGAFYASGASNYFDGVMDEIRVYDGALGWSTWRHAEHDNFHNCSDGGFFDVHVWEENKLPVVSNPNPANGSSDIPLNQANWCVNISDDWTNFNYTIQCTNGDKVGVNNATNGTKCLTFTGNLTCDTNYTVYVNVTEYFWNYPYEGEDEQRTVYYWFWFNTISCENVTYYDVSLLVLTGNTTACPCCISLCFYINSTLEMNVTLNSNYSGLWTSLQSFHILTNGTYCFIVNSWTRYNYTYYFNYSYNNGVNYSDTGVYYINTNNLSNCNSSVGLSDNMNVVVNIESGLLFLMILIICWLFFIDKYFKTREIGLAWGQFLCAFPLTFLIGAMSLTYTMGFAILFVIPILGIIIMADAYFRR